MNFQGISVSISPEINTLDQTTIGTYREKIFDTIRSEFYPGYRKNKMTVERVDQLSPVSALVHVNVWDELEEEELDFASLLAVNFVSELHKIHLTALMKAVINKESFPKVILKLDAHGPELFVLADSKIFFEFGLNSKTLITVVRGACVSLYMSSKGHDYNLSSSNTEQNMLLTGTKEVATGKIWYFPSTKPA